MAAAVVRVAWLEAVSAVVGGQQQRGMAHWTSWTHSLLSQCGSDWWKQRWWWVCDEVGTVAIRMQMVRMVVVVARS